MLTDAPVGRSEYAPRLLTGGFPESLTRTGAARARFFQATSARSSTAICAMPRAYMTRGRSGRCCDSSPLGRLRSPATRTLGRDAGIDGKTAKSHMDVLERLFLVRVRRPWHANLGKRQVKAPKAYVADTGLQAGLIGIDEQRYATTTDSPGRCSRRSSRPSSSARRPGRWRHRRSGITASRNARSTSSPSAPPASWSASR